MDFRGTKGNMDCRDWDFPLDRGEKMQYIRNNKEVLKLTDSKIKVKDFLELLDTSLDSSMVTNPKICFFFLNYSKKPVETLPLIDSYGEIVKGFKYQNITINDGDIVMHDYSMKYCNVGNITLGRSIINLTIENSLISNIKLKNCYISNLDIYNCGFKENFRDNYSIATTPPISIKGTFVHSLVIKDGVVVKLEIDNPNNNGIVDLVREKEMINENKIKI